MRAALLDLVEDSRELLAQEDRDDRRRRLVGAQAVVVAAAGDRAPSRPAWLCTAFGSRGEEHQEAQVLVWRLARLEQVLSPVSSPIDQLLCLPEPLMPAKGFSCSSDRP